MDIVARFNLYEAILWFVIAIIFLGFGVYKKNIFAQKKTFLFLSVILALFGISDLIEMKTGTWWKPAWLLVMKAFCITSIVVGLFSLSRGRGGTCGGQSDGA